ncbi:MAG: alkaline phosphatase family protein [Candidatus Krumholzibacteriota bacterium]
MRLAKMVHHGRFLFLLVSLSILLSGCGGQEQAPDPEARKLLVIGIDSADWRLLEPMMDDGRLPHLKAFMAQSSHGRMKTFYPLEKSPLLWASILTGVRPEVHGVNNFVKGSDQKPVTGSAWYAPALWDMIGAAGMSTAVAGMWTTYPTRPIDGVMVSDYLPYGRGRDRPLANLVHPDSLTDAVVALRVDPDGLSDETLLRFLNTDDLAAVEEKFPRDMDKLRDILAADLGYLAVSRMLAETGDFDLFFFYLRGPDMISHHFYDFLKPEKVSARLDPEKVAVFKDVVTRYYDWSDEVMGEVLGWFPADRQTVVLSDHGFYGPRSSGQKGTHEHSEWGIFLVRSPLYEAGRQFGHLELLDICPTFLALMGLPPAKDMPGKILLEGATESGLKRLQKMEGKRVESYLPLRPAVGPEGERDPGVDEEIRKQLRSLGYIK